MPHRRNIFATSWPSIPGSKLPKNAAGGLVQRWQAYFREQGISNVDQLVCLLTMPGQGELAIRVVEALLNNETYFFRDIAYFQTVRETVIPRLMERRRATKQLRIWSAGCSTGQEALSLAMIFAENPAMWRGWKIEIFGSDVSGKAIEAARTAHYSQFEIQRGMSVAQMLNFFTETDDGWQANKELRDMTQFDAANLLEMGVPSKPYDLVLCRNVLLYFEAETRRRAFDQLSRSIAPDGWLMLGAGETAIGQTALFRPAKCGNALYRVVTEADADTGRIARTAAA